jgi:hypothetical protein
MLLNNVFNLATQSRILEILIEVEHVFHTCSVGNQGHAIVGLHVFSHVFVCTYNSGRVAHHIKGPQHVRFWLMAGNRTQT